MMMLLMMVGLVEWSRGAAMILLAVVVQVLLIFGVVVVARLEVLLLECGTLHRHGFQLVSARACGDDVEVHVGALLLLFDVIFDVHCVRLCLQVAIVLLHSKLAVRSLALTKPVTKNSSFILSCTYPG